MASDAPRLTPDRLLLIRRGFIDARILQTAAKVGIFDALNESSGLTWKQLGERAGLITSPEFHGTRDFLDMLVALGALERDGEGHEAAYRNSAEADAFLVTDRPASIAGLLVSDHDRTMPNLLALGEALKTGEVSAATQERLGIPPCTDMFADPAAGGAFAKAMLAHKIDSFQLLARSFDFGRFSSLADIGGSLGALCAEACLAHPELRAQTCDLPALHAPAADYIDSRGVADRVQAADLDMFSEPFPRVDVIAMSQILHDWGLPRKKMLIRKAFEALPAGGALLAVEQFIDDARRTHNRGLSLSLIMLLEFGKENAHDMTASDFEALTAEAGFTRWQRLPLLHGFSAVAAFKD